MPKPEKTTSPTDAEIAQLCMLDMKNKWLSHVECASPADNESLLQLTERFVFDMMAQYARRYPELYSKKDGLLWSLLFNAIASSETHHPDIVWKMESKLRAKHGLELSAAR